MIQKSNQLYTLIKESLRLNFFSITSSLSDFYSKTSTKRSNTRKRPWPEFEHILSEIHSYVSKIQDQDAGKLITILELGCGDGRLAEYFDQQGDLLFRYIGVDCSQGLIDIARSKEYTNNDISFYVGDMLGYLQYLEQDSIDIIISIASIQHLHKNQRQALWDESYRVLTFLGKHITINRSYSQWLLKKHWMSFIAGYIACIGNWKTFGFGDALIPFIDTKTKKYTNQSPLGVELRHNNTFLKNEIEMHTSYRFYHFFTLYELRSYIRKSGLIASKAKYVDSVGRLSDKLRHSRNTLVVGEKDILSHK